MPNLIPQLEHSTLQSLLSIYSEIADSLTFEDYVKFIELVQILKPTVTLSLLPDEAGPPDHLHIPIHGFLPKACQVAWIKVCVPVVVAGGASEREGWMSQKVTEKVDIQSLADCLRHKFPVNETPYLNPNFFGWSKSINKRVL